MSVSNDAFMNRCRDTRGTVSGTYAPPSEGKPVSKASVNDTAGAPPRVLTYRIARGVDE